MVSFLNDLLGFALDFFLDPSISLNICSDPLIVKIVGNLVDIWCLAVVVHKEEFLLFIEDFLGVRGWLGIERVSMNTLPTSLGE